MPASEWIGALFSAQNHEIQEIGGVSFELVYTAQAERLSLLLLLDEWQKGCRLGRNNCCYLILLPPKPKSECDGCPYGRDHLCIGWCTKKVMREVGLC